MDLDKEKTLKAPEEFPFPFEPYHIQVDFMKSLYEAIEGKKIAIFESPTGTGKSLSLICGSLTWLHDHERRIKNALESSMTSNSLISTAESSSVEPSWINEFVQKQIVNAKVEKAKVLKTSLEKREQQRMKARMSTLKCQSKREQYMKRKKTPQDETVLLMEQAKKELANFENGQGDVVADEEFALEAYESDDEIKSNADDDEIQTEEDKPTTKIFFCSRTHSQLSQFIHELQKSPFGKLNPGENDDSISQISVATLASRKTFCVNDMVRKLPTIHQINEKCLDMQKNAKKKEKDDSNEPKKRKRSGATCSCPYYRNEDGLTLLTNRIVGSIMDVEDLVKEGKDVVACPYYASRNSLPYSQLVVLPYQTLLHESTRLASKIDIRNSVIIIDEAHNLVEAINSMYSCMITAKQINKALNQLTQYMQKFNKRLKAKNLYYVKQLVYVLRRLLAVLNVESNSKSSTGQASPKPHLLTLTAFLFKSKLDNINFFKLLRYCSKSKISFKLSGFIEKYDTPGELSKPRSALSNFLTEMKSPESKPDGSSSDVTSDVTMKSPLMHIETFVKSLTSLTEDCRIAVTTGNEASLKFLRLSPAQHFKQILDDCRALIVAGGTMQPSSCLVNQLLPRNDVKNYLSRIVEFSCDHVIDGATQLLPLVLSCGPSSKKLEFTFEKRSDSTLILELGRMLLNMINVIPGGIVCFFPSYEYESFVYELWMKEGVLVRLENRKKVFREPKNSSHVDTILNEYSKTIARTKTPGGKINGAILLSVVNGKMSEGINFSDDLGRCVVMVGLPYPNLHSPELKEKLSYLNQHLPKGDDGRSAGQIHYENLCMKAVNQSIGRAIRHKNDYACLLFADHRYARPAVASKLPDWIGKHLKKADSFGQAFATVRKFFNGKKESTE